MRSEDAASMGLFEVFEVFEVVEQATMLATVTIALRTEVARCDSMDETGYIPNCVSVIITPSCGSRELD
jgi:hypothetical protein